MSSPSNAPDPAAALRVSDADRERVAAALRRHHVDGRIDTDELQERLGRCYAARTADELAALVADLPQDERTRAPRPSAGHPRAPLAVGLLLLVLALAVVGAVAHGHPGPFPFLAALLLLKLAWVGPRRRRTAWGHRG